MGCIGQPRSTKLPSLGMMCSGCASSTLGRRVWLAAIAAFSPMALSTHARRSRADWLHGSVIEQSALLACVQAV